MITQIRLKVALILCYWLISGGLTLYNKWLLQVHFPFLLILCTYSLNVIVSHFYRHCVVKRCYKVKTTQFISSRNYFRYIIPIGLLSAMEIVTSNLSLITLSLSFHTMIHASKPATVLFWSVVFRLQQLRLMLLVIVFLIMLGVSMVSLSEFELDRLTLSNMTTTTTTTADLSSTVHTRSSFSTPGFILLLLSVFSSGCRWSVTQLLLQEVSFSIEKDVDAQDFESDQGQEEEDMFQPIQYGSTSGADAATLATSNSHHALSPINLLYYVSPVSVLSLLPCFVFFEMDRLQVYFQTHEVDVFEVSMLVLFCGCMALTLILLEFLLIQLTSSLTLSIAAIVKEMLLVAVAAVFYHNKFSALNLFGFLVCMLGAALYNYDRYVDDAAPQKAFQRVADVEGDPAVAVPSAEADAVQILLDAPVAET